MLGVEDWAEIRRLRRAEGMPILAIARVMGVSRNTVKRALVADGPPRYQRPVRGSIVDAVEPQIRELLGVWPSMPATVVAERIGWQRSIRVLRDRVAELRPVYLPPDPASSFADRALLIPHQRLGHPTQLGQQLPPAGEQILSRS